MSALGDVVHALPLANALRRTYPEARISWVVQPVPASLLAHHPAVDEVILFQRRRGWGAWRPLAELARAVRGRRYDLVLTPQVALKAGLVTALLHSPVQIGYDRRRSPELTWLFCNRHIPAGPVRHIQDEFLEFLQYLDIATEPVEWRITLSPEEQRLQRQFFDRIDRPVCAMVVASSRREKDWASERMAAVADALAVDHGLHCLLLGGPADADRRAAERVLSLASSRPSVVLGDDVRRLIQLLAGSALVISPDSGPLHIARALEVPVVGLFGYTNPKRWGPYRRFTELVADGFARYPGEDYPVEAGPREDGMERVTVAMVLQRVALALERYGVDRSPA